MQEINFGINDIVFSAPSLAITAEELVKAFAYREKGKEGLENAEALKNDTEKMKYGLGINQIRIPGYSESNASFVADALYLFAKEIMKDPERMKKLDTEPIRSIYYSSESNPDRSRPEIEAALLLASAKLIEDGTEEGRKFVRLLRQARLIPITFACAGGGLALLEAVTNVKSFYDVNISSSALVITADTSVYDNSKAPNAEFTQGSGSFVMWITKDPKIAKISYERGIGSFHIPLADFTKFGDEIPVVHGKFSERVYVYAVAKALEEMENSKGINDVSFFVTHVPFPKQAIYFASFLFAHQLRKTNHALLEEIEKREGVGKEPLGNHHKLTELIDKKLEEFNKSTPILPESKIIDYIENDPEINAYWDWLKKLRSQKEFDDFINALNIKNALILPSNIGNSYSSSAFAAFTSMLLNSEESKLLGKAGVLAFYGSGAIASIIPVTIASSQGIKSHIYIDDKSPIYIDSKQYIQLHEDLVRGEVSRTVTHSNLLEKDLKFLGMENLAKGFHIVRRNNDGTGEYAYSDGNSISELVIRY
ncbi:MAG: hydroxymethylglutaryl-CoA synthase [Candidatus Micrarchaeia archaeon]